MMSEEIRAAMAQSQWEITKGHIRASVSLRSSRRATAPVKTREEDDTRHQQWERFQEAAEQFIKFVENEGWHE